MLDRQHAHRILLLLLNAARMRNAIADRSAISCDLSMAKLELPPTRRDQQPKRNAAHDRNCDLIFNRPWLTELGDERGDHGAISPRALKAISLIRSIA
jgi:hypothetical protein